MYLVASMISAVGIGFLNGFFPALTLPMSIILGALIIALAIDDKKR